MDIRIAPSFPREHFSIPNYLLHNCLNIPMNFLPDKSAAEVVGSAMNFVTRHSGCGLFLHKQCDVILPYYTWSFFRIKIE